MNITKTIETHMLIAKETGPRVGMDEDRKVPAPEPTPMSQPPEGVGNSANVIHNNLEELLIIHSSAIQELSACRELFVQTAFHSMDVGRQMDKQLEELARDLTPPELPTAMTSMEPTNASNAQAGSIKGG